MKLKHLILGVLLLTLSSTVLFGEDYSGLSQDENNKTFLLDDLRLRDMDSHELIMSKSTENIASGDSWNTTLIGRWANGPCYAVDVVSNIAYFGNGGYLEIVDISNPANPVELSKIVMPSVVKDVAVSGSYAYVADRYDGLRIIDISNSASPTETGFFDTGDYACGVAVSGSYAYVADGSAGLRIIDISNPAAPTETGFFDTGNWASGVAVSGSYAYVADGYDGLRIIDISTPASPTETGFFDTGDWAYGVAVSGSYAYVADDNAGLRIIDISNPAAPTETGFFDTGDYARGVAVSGSYAYVTDFFNGLRIINISNPAAPTETGFFDTGGYAYGVAVSGSYAYVADHYDGLCIIDISNPAAPAEAGFFDTGDDANDVAVSESYAYVADARTGLRIIDISNPVSPAETGFFDTGGYAYNVAVSGSYAYVADAYNGLRIIDISNPVSPAETGFFDIGYAYGVAVSGSYAYVVDLEAGLCIINISNPASPAETGFFNTGGYVYDVAVSGSYAYVANSEDGLRIIDISNPAAPTETGFFDTGGDAYGVAVSGSYAYVADLEAGLRIINISNPVSPTETGFFDTGSYAWGVAVSGSYAYVADAYNGLRIINISNPAAPTETGFFDTGDWASGVAVSGSYAYVADGYDGLYIIRNDLECSDISLTISDTETNAGNIVSIPVIVDSGFTNVAMMELHIKFDTTLLYFQDMSSSYLSSGDVNSVNDKINIVWIYSGTAVDIPDEDTLIVLNFQVDNNASEGQTCTVEFTGNNVIGAPDESAYSLALNPGTFTVISGYGISGSLTYCDNTSPLIGDTLYLSGDMNENTLTDEYGHYSFDLINGSLTLYPGKHDDISDVNGLDLLRLKNKLLGITTLTPYATLAADCNGSGSVDGLDLLRLKNYLLMIPVDPPIATWGFTPQQYIYDPIGNDMSNQNFGAFIYGDVNLNWGTASQALAKASDQINTNVSFSNFTLDEQGYLHLSICVDNDVQLGMIDWSISFDTTAFSFERIDADFISENDYRNTGDLIKLVWIYDGEEIAFEKDSRIIDLVLMPINNQHNGTVGFTGKNYLATTNEKPIHAEYESITVNLTMLNLLDDMQIPTETTLYDNYPNPFNPITTIKYSLKEDSKVKLEIYNIKGQKVKTLVNDVKYAGYHSAVWDGTDDNRNPVSSGIYLYKMNEGNQIMLKKMLLVK